MDSSTHFRSGASREHNGSSTRSNYGHFRSLVENATDIIERFDRDYRMVYANPALGRYTGIPTDHFIGRTKRQSGMPGPLCDLWEQKLEQTFRSGESTDFEFDYAAPHGQMFLQARLVPEPDDAGVVQFVLSIVRDITAYKHAEQQMRRAYAAADAANSAKDHFLAVLSHELRTPLTPILNAVDLLEAQPELSPEMRESVAMIRRNVELEARLVDDLLDLNRITRGKVDLHLQTIDLHQTVHHVLQNCSHELRDKHLTVSSSLAAQQCWIRADSTRLQQILWNILRNAIKFTPAGGKITLTTHNSTPESISLSISDTGVGIAPESIGRIFEPWEQGGNGVTRQFGGLGLGLAITKALMDLHGGMVQAMSAGRGEGATFTLEFPTCRPAEQPAAVAAPAPSFHPELCRRILLVEDNSDTARVMERLLASHGYRAKIADTVAGALQMAAKEPFDLLISDIGLPDGNGVQLMQELRTRYGTIHGIALSGYGMEEDIKRSLDAGYESHLVKPINFSQLLGAIHSLNANPPSSAKAN